MIRRLACACLLVLAGSPAFARVDVALDAASLTDLLSSMAPDTVKVALTGGRALEIQMKDMKVTGFDPSLGPNGGLTTSLRLLVPELKIDTPVEPKLALEMQEGAGGVKVCLLRFDRVVIDLPITGPIDVASLLPKLPVMPDTGYTVNSARGPVKVTPKLIDARTGAQYVRLGFDLVVTPGP